MVAKFLASLFCHKGPRLGTEEAGNLKIPMGADKKKKNLLMKPVLPTKGLEKNQSSNVKLSDDNFPSQQTPTM